MLKKYKPYIYSILIALAVGGLSALLTKNNMDIYSRIKTPPLSPPSVLFPIVWGILYILMGISSAIVYKNRDENRDEFQSAIFLYVLNLIFNFMWSIIFFNAGAYLFSFIWLIALWLIILAMIFSFYKISHTAAYLQIPYIVWVSFALYLNLFIYILNR